MPTAEKISITMTPEMLRAIRESVDAGEYASTSEVIRHAMRLWQRDRDEHAQTLAMMKRRIRKSIDDPRPDLTEEEAESAIEAMFERVDRELDSASS
jgi:antitoxin ParD1/3/4